MLIFYHHFSPNRRFIYYSLYVRFIIKLIFRRCSISLISIHFPNTINGLFDKLTSLFDTVIRINGIYIVSARIVVDGISFTLMTMVLRQTLEKFTIYYWKWGGKTHLGITDGARISVCAETVAEKLQWNYFTRVLRGIVEAYVKTLYGDWIGIFYCYRRSECCKKEDSLG